jgi:hypothetical protein
MNIKRNAPSSMIHAKYERFCVQIRYTIAVCKDYGNRWPEQSPMQQIVVLSVIFHAAHVYSRKA